MPWKYLIPLLGVSIVNLSPLKDPTSCTFKVKSAYLCVGRGADLSVFPRNGVGSRPRVWYTPRNVLLAARVGQLPVSRRKTEDVTDLIVNLLVQVLRWLV